MFLLVFVLILTFFIFFNPMYYSIMLIMFIMLSIYCLVKIFLINSLISFIFLIIYLGAMMIVIGYVCAVSPNILIKNLSNLKIFFMCFFFFLVEISLPQEMSQNMFSSFFFGPSGFSILMIILILLFLTLLMVTSHYMMPKGPFRSL